MGIRKTILLYLPAVTVVIFLGAWVFVFLITLPTMYIDPNGDCVRVISYQGNQLPCEYAPENYWSKHVGFDNE
jgi:hypothetical protein